MAPQKHFKKTQLGICKKMKIKIRKLRMKEYLKRGDTYEITFPEIHF